MTQQKPPLVSRPFRVLALIGAAIVAGAYFLSRSLAPPARGPTTSPAMGSIEAWLITLAIVAFILAAPRGTFRRLFLVPALILGALAVLIFLV